jgi:Predicted integral membrane protein (DUF2269)
MTYALLRFVHLLGLSLMAAGLVGVWFADVRSRQVRDLRLFAEAVRGIAVFYDGLVVPGALLLLGSGTWLIVTVYGGWAFLGIPWLAGMVVLFAFEFVRAPPRGAPLRGRRAHRLPAATERQDRASDQRRNASCPTAPTPIKTTSQATIAPMIGIRRTNARTTRAAMSQSIR